MAKKTKAPLKGSQEANAVVAEAIRQLLRTRLRQAVLKRRAALLTKLIVDGGGGTAHGYRAYMTHVSGGTYYRKVTVKPRDQLKLVPVAVASSK